MNFKYIYWPMAILIMSVQIGCAEVSQTRQRTWHQNFNWKAEEYFDDPNVVALCNAIEANDLAAIDRLVADGADVNALGKDNMTPLLWAFPDNKLDRFKKLLQLGANPNVIVESDFGTRSAIMKGNSVTHMACKTSFPGYFEAVFENGGDPNITNNAALGSGDTPIFTVIKHGGQDTVGKIRLLIEMGADLNHMNNTGITPTIQAVSWGGQYDIALMLLHAGADYRKYRRNGMSKLVHRVVEDENRLPQGTSQRNPDYQKLVEWLVDHGESIEEARADMRRWESWSITTGEFQRKKAQEVAQRKAREAREAREKQAAESKADDEKQPSDDKQDEKQ